MGEETYLPPIVVSSAGHGLYVARGMTDDIGEDQARAALSQFGNVMDLVCVDRVYVAALDRGHPTTEKELSAVSDHTVAIRRAAAGSEIIAARLKLVTGRSGDAQADEERD